MKSGPFRVKLGEIIDAKRQAIGQLIRDAVAASVTVHIGVKSEPSVDHAYNYLISLGFKDYQICIKQMNPEGKPLHVHSVIDQVRDDDLRIDLDDIYTPS